MSLVCKTNVSNNEANEPDLNGVDEEDKTNVNNILVCLKALKYFGTYNINVVPRGYEILAWFALNETADTFIKFDTVSSLIRAVDELRVSGMGLKFFAGRQQPCFRVFLLARKERMMIEDVYVHASIKRRKMFNE
jgi:hypothetical protein